MSGDRLRTLMSFKDPDILNKTCQIQVSWSATASRITVEPFFLAVELSMPCLRTVLLTPMHAICWAKHTWEPMSYVHLPKPCGVFNIWSSQIFRTKHLHNSDYEALDTHDGLILTHVQWSSTRSAKLPYANIRKAAVTFWKVLWPSSPAAFLLCWKNQSWLASFSAMHLNNSMLVLKRRRKYDSGYVGFSTK